MVIVPVVLAVVLVLLVVGPWAARARPPAVEPDPVTVGAVGRAGGGALFGGAAWSAGAVVLAVAVWFLAALVAGLALPAAVGVPVAAGVARTRVVTVREARRRRAVERATPDLVDLLAVAASAGHPPHRCLHVVAGRAPPEVAGSIAASCRRLDRGVPLSDAVADLRGGLGPLGDAVADALVDAFRTGAPLPQSLGRVAEVARDRRRRDAETEARRLPVLLLFPLVCCILPAFGLLAVVPLVAASLRSLG